MAKAASKSKPSRTAPTPAKSLPAKSLKAATKAKAPVKAPARPAAKVARPAAQAKSAAPAAKPGKWVYTFGAGKAEGTAGMRDLLGGKGANLAEMANLGLPVPPGFTIPTSVCTYFYAHDKSYPK